MGEYIVSRKLLDESRLDYILIWGHGIKYYGEILNYIRKQESFFIKKIVRHKTNNIAKLVKHIYSYDYAPFWHLKSKTKYLKKTGQEVIFIFFENYDPDVDFYGEGYFRHIESTKLKKFKESLRNKFNPYNNGKRTEDHVIHASDNEAQTDYILHYLGFERGIKEFSAQPDVLPIKNYMRSSNRWLIKKIKLEDLYCNIAIHGKANETRHILKSPHYLGITKDIKIYEDYILTHSGKSLRENYSVDKFLELAKSLKYLNKAYSMDYIFVEQSSSKYIIQDGLHRASILASRGLSELIVGVYNDKN